jgi:hypothetical protein
MDAADEEYQWWFPQLLMPDQLVFSIIQCESNSFQTVLPPAECQVWQDMEEEKIHGIERNTVEEEHGTAKSMC